MSGQNIFFSCFVILTLRKVMIENKCIDGNYSHFRCVRLILMFYLFFFTYCIMMVVKLAATTAIIKYLLVKFYYLTYGEHK